MGEGKLICLNVLVFHSPPSLRDTSNLASEWRSFEGFACIRPLQTARLVRLCKLTCFQLLRKRHPRGTNFVCASRDLWLCKQLD